MKRSVAGLALVVLLGKPAAAHRLDEYLQASLISLSTDCVQVQLSLTPGVAVLPLVLSGIDTDGDGTISELERNAYAARVLRDLSLKVDGEPIGLRLVSSQFPEMKEMQEGLGAIRLEMAAALPPSWSGRTRRVSFVNHHQSRISAYLVNSLVPQATALQITAQSRDFRQSLYEVDFLQRGATWTGWRASLWAAMLLLLARTAILWRRGRPCA